jgi:hypothetical protein
MTVPPGMSAASARSAEGIAHPGIGRYRQALVRQILLEILSLACSFRQSQSAQEPDSRETHAAPCFPELGEARHAT